MAVNGMSSYTTSLRLTGLGGSGIDTDQVVSQLMRAERMPLDKLSQKKQLAEWKTDSYREITNLLRGFKDEFLNYGKPSSNMLSQSQYKAFKASAVDSVTQAASSEVSATTSSSATSGNHTVKVVKMATAESISSAASAGGISGDLLSSNIVDFANLKGQKFNLNIDGVTKSITFNSGYDFANLNDVITNAQYGLNKLIGDAFGTGKVTLTDESGKLKIAAAGGVTKISLTNGTTSGGLSAMKFSTGASNRINLDATLGDLQTKGSFRNGITFGGAGSDTLQFAINGKTFTFTKTDTLKSMMDKINIDTTANVNMQYDELSDKFKITSKQLGEGNAIVINETQGNFVTGAAYLDSKTIEANSKAALTFTNNDFNINIDGAGPQNITVDGVFATANDLKVYLQGQIDGVLGPNKIQVENVNGVIKLDLLSGNKFTLTSGGSDALAGLGFSNNSTSGTNLTASSDAEVEIDGQTIKRSTNSIAANGITYNLLKEGGNTQNINVSTDVDTVVNNIKKFVEKYNEVLSTMNNKLAEKYDRNYQPLTSEQKESMEAEDIKKWEDRAKIGLLRNDSMLQNIANKFRNALSDSVADVAKNLSGIGITTGKYEDKGKLILDSAAEIKLRSAIENDPDSVMNLFTKKSSITTNIDIDQNQKKQRYSEEGLAFRVLDVIEDNIRTVRDSHGYKGLLLEKAGIQGDASEFRSTLFTEITAYDTEMTQLSERLTSKENQYYAKFSAMEEMISKMNSQSSWLSQQLGGIG